MDVMAALSIVGTGDAAAEPAVISDDPTQDAAFLAVLTSVAVAPGVASLAIQPIEATADAPTEASRGVVSPANDLVRALPMAATPASPATPAVADPAMAADLAAVVRPTTAPEPQTVGDPAVAEPATPVRHTGSVDLGARTIPNPAVAAIPSAIALERRTVPAQPQAHRSAGAEADTARAQPTTGAPISDAPIAEASAPVAHHAAVARPDTDAPVTSTTPMAAERAVEVASPLAALGPRPRSADRRPEAVGDVHSAAAPVELATGAAPAAELAPPEPVGLPRTLEAAIAAQLVDRISVLGTDHDGDHDLTLQLDPADLGHLDLRVRVESGVVHVQVAARSTTTAELLRDALPDLQAALLDAGLNAGSLDVSTQQHSSSADRQDTSLVHAATDRPSHPGPTRRPIHRLDAHGVDVLL